MSAECVCVWERALKATIGFSYRTASSASLVAPNYRFHAESEPEFPFDRPAGNSNSRQVN